MMAFFSITSMLSENALQSIDSLSVISQPNFMSIYSSSYKNKKGDLIFFHSYVPGYGPLRSTTADFKDEP
jgi:hypothetical protein